MDETKADKLARLAHEARRINQELYLLSANDIGPAYATQASKSAAELVWLIDQACDYWTDEVGAANLIVRIAE